MAVTAIPRPKTKQAEFFGRIMQIRDLAHLTHLRQYHSSGWEHKALNILYDEVLDIVDTIIESWQGIYGLVDITVPETKPQKDSVAMTREIYQYIEENRGMFKESWLQNEIDNICTLLAQTLYRLQYVK